MRKFIFLVGLLVTSTGANAERASLLESTYEPYTEIRDGRVEICGVKFQAIGRDTETGLFSIEGNFSWVHFQGDELKYMMKVYQIAKPSGGSDFQPVPISDVIIRSGGIDTLSAAQFSPTDFPESRVFSWDFLDAGVVASKFAVGLLHSASISWVRSDTNQDLSLQLDPLSKYPEINTNFAQCMRAITYPVLQALE